MYKTIHKYMHILYICMHTHIHIYIYVYVCMCMYVSVGLPAHFAALTSSPLCSSVFDKARKLFFPVGTGRAKVATSRRDLEF